MIGRTPVDIVVADDHELVRLAIVAHLVGDGHCRCVAEAETGREAVDAIMSTAPPVAFVDVGLPDMEGFDVVRAIIEAGSQTRVVLVSSRINDDLVQQGFASGAWGYLSKVSSAGLLTEALQAVLGGARFVDPEVAAVPSAPASTILDADELRVLEQMAVGHDDAAIATRLQVPVEVVAARVVAVLRKLDCDTRGGAVARAIRDGSAK